jgi:hypothetical protein
VDECGKGDVKAGTRLRVQGTRKERVSLDVTRDHELVEWRVSDPYPLGRNSSHPRRPINNSLPLSGGCWEGVSELYNERPHLSPPLRGEEI